VKLILASKKDPAAQNIATCLLELYPFRRVGEEEFRYGDAVLAYTEKDSAEIDFVPPFADETIVVSRHVSESHRPTLSVHVPGKPEEKRLGIAKPSTVGSILRALHSIEKKTGLGYEVSLEATHHGPTDLEVPVTFVEIGSSPREWVDRKAGEVVARAVISASTPKCLQAVGVGGPHYSPRHTEACLYTKVWVGHVLPKYVSLDEELLELAVERTQGGVSLFLVDKKGLNSIQRRIVFKASEKLGIKVINTTDAAFQQSFKT